MKTYNACIAEDVSCYADNIMIEAASDEEAIQLAIGMALAGDYTSRPCWENGTTNLRIVSVQDEDKETIAEGIELPQDYERVQYAAEELLDACKQALSMREAQLQFDTAKDPTCRCLRAAIAKAEEPENPKESNVFEITSSERRKIRAALKRPRLPNHEEYRVETCSDGKYQSHYGLTAPRAGAAWSGPMPIPQRGDRVFVDFNGFGPGTVRGYFTEWGGDQDYLGVYVECDTPPDWWVLQQLDDGDDRIMLCTLAFGAELKLIGEA
ncbi:MAG: hypothetical protein ABSG53_00105 [Thermoguttaceae bacterium]|jgi:hypothetical protein